VIGQWTDHARPQSGWPDGVYYLDKSKWPYHEIATVIIGGVVWVCSERPSLELATATALVVDLPLFVRRQDLRRASPFMWVPAP
jgi:hypothetical protein